jgi:hypothetical protein
MAMRIGDVEGDEQRLCGTLDLPGRPFDPPLDRALRLRVLYQTPYERLRQKTTGPV